MEELINITEEALYKYFNSLASLGYKKYSEVYSLLVLMFVEETIPNEFSVFVTEEDYRSILNALECLYGSNDMINMPAYYNFDNIIHETKTYLIPRITENGLLKICQSGLIRTEI